MTDPLLILFLIATPMVMIWLAVRQLQIQKLLKNLLPSKWEGYGVWGDWIDAERHNHDYRIRELSEKIDRNDKAMRSLNDAVDFRYNSIAGDHDKEIAALKDRFAKLEQTSQSADPAVSQLATDINTIFSRLDALEKPRTTAAISNLAKAISKKPISKPRPAAITAARKPIRANGVRHASR